MGQKSLCIQTVSYTHLPEPTDRVKYNLDEEHIPTYWYNILPDLPFEIGPPLNPKTLEPAGPEDLSAIFPMSVIEQEMSTQPIIDIPGEVLDIYKLWRPTPLVRAQMCIRDSLQGGDYLCF